MYAFTNRDIVIMPYIRIIVIIIPFLALISLFKSLKNHNTMPVLIQYSKSKMQNKNIYVIYFLKQTFVNNLLLIIFDIITLKFLNNKE